MSQVAHQGGAYPRFCSMKSPGVFLLPLDRMVVQCSITSIKFGITCLYTFSGEGHCVLPKNTTQCPGRAQTQTAQSEDERSNHETTAPLSKWSKQSKSKSVV